MSGNADIHGHNSESTTLMYAAKSNPDLGTIEALIAAGASVGAEDDRGEAAPVLPGVNSRMHIMTHILSMYWCCPTRIGFAA